MDVLLLAAVLVATYLAFKVTAQRRRVGRVAAAPAVVAVSADFDWQREPPRKLYPFKDAPYKLTMGIQRLEAQDWLLIENTYAGRIAEKTRIVTNRHDGYPPDKDLAGSTVLVTEECTAAVREFYDTVIGYMCTKYPQYFVKKGAVVHNRITNDTVPLSAATEPPRSLLLALARTIEEDFIILTKDPRRANEADGTEYFFKGGIFAFAAGFDPRDRFDTPLLFIHHPIPGYESKLKLSMNRFFDRLAPGQFVTRSNFLVQTHNKFYVDDQNKGHNVPKGTQLQPLRREELDFDRQVHYRSERQVLTKLPQTGAVVFTIRTYLEPMSALKRQGPEVTQRFIGAIRGFPDDIAEYKRLVEWGPAVVAYLQEATTPPPRP